MTVGGGRERRAAELVQIAAHEIALDFEADPVAERIAEREVGIESEIFIKLDLAGAETRGKGCGLRILGGVQAGSGADIKARYRLGIGLRGHRDQRGNGRTAKAVASIAVR